MVYLGKIQYVFLVAIILFLVPIHTAFAQTLPTEMLLDESFQDNLSNWDFETPVGCTIGISNSEDHTKYNTPFSPDGGDDLLISREAGNFECYVSYFPKEEIKTSGYLSLYFYDNLEQTNDLNFLSIVKNTKGDAVSLAVRKQISTDEYVLRINTGDYRTGIKRTKGWQFFEFILKDNKIYTRLNNNDLLNYPYPNNFSDIHELRFGAGWNTKQAARIDGVLVRKQSIYPPAYCNEDICKVLDLP
ncbi:MAG: hypothetical protein Q8P72_02580, partial [Candidatus Roizmanbacteria bacterium]|nr:hypothetical protein [Candidatus Roizmanbacteria bacterium]